MELRAPIERSTPIELHWVTRLCGLWSFEGASGRRWRLSPLGRLIKFDEIYVFISGRDPGPGLEVRLNQRGVMELADEAELSRRDILEAEPD